MSFDGTWDLTINTPMGAQQSSADLSTSGSTLTGKITGDGATVEIYDGTVDGNSASWKTNITEPLPMTLTFTAEVDGDSISGKADPGMFPASPFTGTRAGP